MSASAPLGLGLDLGGSSTRWQLQGPSTTVAHGKLRPLGGHLYDEAGKADAQRLLDELERALADSGPPDPGAIVAGVTGLGEGSDEARWLHSGLAQRWPAAGGRIVVLDDIELAFRGAFPAGDGVLVYGGTGAIAVGRGADGHRIRAGGHGYLLDDDGGGFSIGRAALRAVLREADATGRPGGSALARRLYAIIGGEDWQRIRAYAYGGGRSVVAALAPAVAAAADEGDPQAREILAWAGRELARLARLVLGRIGETRPVALAGGIARVGGMLERSFREGLPAGARPFIIRDEPVAIAARLALEEATRHGRPEAR